MCPFTQVGCRAVPGQDPPDRITVGSWRTTADHLRSTLDGRWAEVREKARIDLSTDEFRPHYTPDIAQARAKTLEQMRVLATGGFVDRGFGVEIGSGADPGAR